MLLEFNRFSSSEAMNSQNTAVTGLNARCDNGVICFPLLARKQSLK